MILFILVLIKGFSFVGQMRQETDHRQINSQFMVWALGASLFAHAATFVSVSYFDQSVVFIYLTLAGISSARFGVASTANETIEKPYAHGRSMLVRGGLKESIR